MAKNEVKVSDNMTAEQKAKMASVNNRNRGGYGGNNTTMSKSSNTTKADTGNFQFGQIMDDFFKTEYEADSDAGLQKQAFQGNLVQSMFDNQMSMALAEFNKGVAQSNMTHQADLEQRNQSALMKDEFTYGMQSMDAQFQYKNQFANAQHDRDLGMVSAVGTQDRLNIAAQGQQDRLGYIVQGEQQRLTDKQNNASKEKIAQGRYDADKYITDSEVAGRSDVAKTQADASRDVAGIGADADKTVAATQADASKDVAKTQAGADTTVAETQAGASKDVAKTQAGATVSAAQIGADAEKFAATAGKEASMYGADKTVDVAKIGAQGTIDNTAETGKQTRLTQDNEARNKAKDRANMHMYARNTARAF